jgi:hypothetical protein
MPAPRTIATLSRWAAVAGPAVPMPQSLAELPLHQQLQVRDADPELALILSGEAMPAALEAAVLSGSWPAEKPQADPEAERRAAVERILAGGNPFIPGATNVTAQLHLERLDPQAAAQQRELAAPYIAQAQQQEQQRRALEQQQLAEGRVDFQNAMAQSAARETLGVG